MNNLDGLTQLHNHYFVMRHGESKANIAGIIISSPENGVKIEYNLSEKGVAQAEASAKSSGLSATTIIYSSDFSRAKQTAEIVADVIGASRPQITPALRERHFGNYESMSNSYYQDVWNDDVSNPHHQTNNVESVVSVVERVTCFILELEKQYTNQQILLVSHGDTLQILQTAFEKIDCRHHRDLTHLETAEIRELQLK